MNDNTFDDLSDKTETELSHYGTPRHSGRYPWGSGDNPYQNSDDFYSRVNELKSSLDSYANADGNPERKKRRRVELTLALGRGKKRRKKRRGADKRAFTSSIF